MSTQRAGMGLPGNAVAHWLRGLFPLLWIAVLSLILYARTIPFDYTYLDDHQLVLGQMESLAKASAIPRAFTEDVFHNPGEKAFYYRPMLTVSFAIDAMVGGRNFAWFHVTNILLHILAAWLLFLLLTELGYERIKSFLFTLIFLAHPVLVHAVAWVPGRNDTLLAVFVFGSVLFFIRYMKTRDPARGMWHVALFVLALFTKETAISVPVICIAYVLLADRKNRKALLFPGIAWLIITPAWLYLRYRILGGSHGYPIAESLSSILHNLPALLPFVGKSLIPAGLSVFPIMKDMRLSMFIGIAGILAISALIILTKQKDWRRILFAVAWFLLFLIPAFIKSKSQEPDFTEHRVYVSLAGLIMLILEIAPIKNLQNFPSKTRSFNITSSFLICIFLIFFILSIFHSRNYRNRIAFWTNAVEMSPSHAFNYNNLGAMYFLDNNLAEAEKYFRKAIEINPLEPLANGNIGLVCMDTDRPEEAEKHYLIEIEINPGYDNVYFNLGLLYAKHNLPEQAALAWEKLLAINPYYTEAYTDLIILYTGMNRQADAERIRAMAGERGIALKN